MNTGGNQAAGLLGPGGNTGQFGNGKDPNVGKDTQFKKGQSGNPAGKPKGTVNLSTMVQKMMNDPGFIDKLSETIKNEAKLPDPEYQGTPMKAIIATAMVEAMSMTQHPTARHNARTWIKNAGWGTQVDVTSKGERIAEAPKLVSIINAQPTGDAPVEVDVSAAVEAEAS